MNYLLLTGNPHVPAEIAEDDGKLDWLACGYDRGSD